MEGYKEKLRMLFRETSKAIRILTDVRQECAEAFVAIMGEKMDEEDTQE